VTFGREHSLGQVRHGFQAQDIRYRDLVIARQRSLRTLQAKYEWKVQRYRRNDCEDGRDVLAVPEQWQRSVVRCLAGVARIMDPDGSCPEKALSAWFSGPRCIGYRSYFGATGDAARTSRIFRVDRSEYRR